MSWFALRVNTGAHRDEVIAKLFEEGAPGVHEDGLALVSHFGSEAAARRAAVSVRIVEPRAQFTIEPVPEVDWTLAWRANARAVSLGGLTVAPPWCATGLEGSTTVVIDPGMAFGTGDHASTRGALRLLQAAMRPPVLREALGQGGRAILAGMLVGEREAFAARLTDTGWRAEAEDEEGEWWSVLVATA